MGRLNAQFLGQVPSSQGPWLTPRHIYISELFSVIWLHFFMVLEFPWFTNTSVVPPVGFKQGAEACLVAQKRVLFWESAGNLMGVSCAI